MARIDDKAIYPKLVVVGTSDEILIRSSRADAPNGIYAVTGSELSRIISMSLSGSSLPETNLQNGMTFLLIADNGENKKGLYQYLNREWNLIIGEGSNTGLSQGLEFPADPNKDDLFALKEDIENFSKGIYCYNGSEWIIYANAGGSITPEQADNFLNTEDGETLLYEDGTPISY